MGIMILIFLTSLASVICGAVLLIQMGGWLATLSAILIIIHYFLAVSLLVILMAGVVAQKKKKGGEQ